MSLLNELYDPASFREMGHRLIDQLADHWSNVQAEESTRPVFPHETATAKRDQWRSRLAEGTDDPNQLFQAMLDQSISVHHPHFMGHQICPPAPLASLAGLVGDALNNGMAIYEMGMASTSAEVAAVEWIAREMGLGPEAGGFFTSGGTLANMTALLTARSVKVPQAVWTEGSRERLALMVSEQAHYCVDRAARIMGWGDEGVIKIPTDEQFRMRTEELPRYLAEAQAKGIRVIAVVGSACTTASGSFDDLEAIADFCTANDLWFHIDGAHGLPLAFSPKYDHWVKGLERADSMILDFHKMLLTPSITTALLYKRNRDSYQTFRQRANYLLEWEEPDDWYNLARRTFECTKLMLGFKAYTLMATYGRSLFEEYVARVCDLGRMLAQLVATDDQLELLMPPDCNIVCFRYRPGQLSTAELNELNRHLRQQMLEDGQFYIVQTELRCKLWLRCTLTNALTEERHLKAMLNEVKRVGDGLK